MSQDEPSNPTIPADASVTDLAHACVEHVRRAVGIELDFTPDTLPILDHYLATLAASEGGRDEIASLVTTTSGAYFGEVVRRTIGRVRWHVEPEDPTGWRLELEHVFLFFNPLGMAREAIAGGDQPGWLAHLEVLPRDRPLLEQALGHMGEVREEDYYRLAVRFEVIEQIVSALEGASIARESQAEMFTPAVYAATARALRGEGPDHGEGHHGN